MIKQSHINTLICCIFLISIVIYTFWGATFSVLGILGVGFVILCFFLLVRSQNFAALRIWKIVIVVLGCIVLSFVIVSKKQSIPTAPSHISSYHGKDITVTGRILNEITHKVDRQEIVLSVSWDRIQGKMLIYAPLYPKYHFGDYIEVSCQIQSTNHIKSRSWARYLALRDIYAMCFWPKIQIVPKPINYFPAVFERFYVPVFQGIFYIKEHLGSQIQKLFPEPSASLLLGLLTGQRSSIPQYLKDDLRAVGLTHIIAMSGYNVSIVINVVFGILLFVGFWRKQAFWISTIFIAIFTFFVGAGASIVRASIMAELTLISRQVSRLTKKHLLLLYSAIMIAIMNPFVVLYDIGFHLSFGATVGLLYIEPILLRLLEKKRLIRYVPTIFMEGITTTFSASIMVQPFLTLYFSQMSLITLLANLIVLPVIPFIMLAGFVAVCVSFLFFPLGKAVGVIAYVLLQYIEKVAGILADVPFALITFKDTGTQYVLFVLNIFILVMIVWMGRKKYA